MVTESAERCDELFFTNKIELDRSDRAFNATYFIYGKYIFLID